MIRINLLPSKESEAALGQRQQRSLLILGVLVTVFIMVVPYLTQQRRITKLERDKKETQRQLDRYSEQVKEVEHLDQLKEDLETKLQIIGDLNEKRLGPQRVLSDLSVAIPDKIWLLEFSEVGSNAKIVGVALDNETVADFMRKMQSSPYFSRVDLDESVGSKEKKLAGFKRFVIKAGIDYAGRAGKQAGSGGEPKKTAAEAK